MTQHNASGPKNGGSYLDNARARHPAGLPDWIAVLARAADAGAARGEFLRALGARLGGVPAATISAVLGNTYPGKTGAIEAKVRGTLMSERVECPVLGFTIGRDVCGANQSARPSAANPTRAKFPRACRGCDNAFAKEATNG
ncbi:MAG: hypothetical protein WDN08_05465 [Rhizomicrobium sp.]